MKVKLIALLILFSILFCSSYSINTVLADTEGADLAAPVIEEVLLSENSIYQGTDIKISLNITDESDISDIIVRYILPTGSKKDVKGFILNEETGYYETTLELAEDAALGLWQVYGIMVQDVSGNFAWVMNSNSYTGTSYELRDFSALDFYVTEAPSDKEPPIINVETIEVSTKKLYQGESFTFSLEVTDEAGINDVLVRYKMPEGGTKDITGFVLNEETGKYQAELVLSEEAVPGLWQIYGIMAQDLFENHTWIMNSNTYEENLYEAIDLSIGDVNVLEVWKDKYAPVIENITISKARAARENKVTIALEITEDTEVQDIILRFATPDDKRVDITGFVLNEETGLYESLYQIPTDAVLGVWQVYGIMAQDTLNNFTWTMNSNLYDGTSYPVKDFSTADMNVVEPVHVESISVTSENITLKPEESSEIIVTYSPEDVTDDIVISYTSSNETVAKIENNKIIAVADGEAIITVDVNGVTKEIKVTVKTEEVINPEVPEKPEDEDKPGGNKPNNDRHDKEHHCKDKHCRHHRFDYNKDGRVNHRDLWHWFRDLCYRFHR